MMTRLAQSAATAHRRALDSLPAIAWLSLFGLLAVMVLFGFLIMRDREELAAAAADHAHEQALILADHAARLFEAAELALATITDDSQRLGWAEISRSKPLWQRMRRLADRLPYVEAFWLNDPSGRLMMTSLTFPAPAVQAADRDYILAHRDSGGGAHVSHVQGPDGRGTFRLSRRQENPDGSFRGVASLTIEADYFQRFYGALPLPPGSMVTLLRSTDLAPVVQARLPSAALVEGTEHIDADHQVPGFPLVVKVSVPSRSLHGPGWEELRSRLAMAGMALAAWAVLTAQGFRQVGRQHRFQQELAERVAARTKELARANAQLETLVHEVHHRVNNNLQIVGSLLTLQSARVAQPAVKAALSQSIGRVHTLSLVHRILYGTGAMVELAFGAYLAALARQIGDLYGHANVDIKVEGADPRFHIDIAVPLALVVHEVLSNVLTHAFPGGRTGSVTIRLESEARHWRLIIADDGIGLPEHFAWTDSQGLGLTIVRSLVEQVGGIATMASDGGTRFELRWPRG